MSKEGKWYTTGFKEALDGLPADPPMQRGHRDCENYLAGFRDGEQQVRFNAEADDRKSRGDEE